MNTRSRSKMGDFNELKALLEAVKLDLGGKIDKLTSLLEEKDKKIREFETKVNFLEIFLKFSWNNSSDFWKILIDLWNISWNIVRAFLNNLLFPGNSWNILDQFEWFAIKI